MSRKQPFDNPEIHKIARHLSENLGRTAGLRGVRIKSITICALTDGGDGVPEGWNLKTGCTCPDCLMRTLEGVASAFGAQIEADGGDSCAAETQDQVH
jgi:hypothetical protein